MSSKHKNKMKNKNRPVVKTTRIKLDKFKKTKKVVNIINIGTLCGSALIVSGLSLILTRPKTSEIEHRELAEFPVLTADSYLSGQYMADISNYYKDTAPLREKLLTVENYVKSVCGVNSENVTFHGNIEMIDSDTGTTETAAVSQEEVPAETTVSAANAKENAETTAESVTEISEAETTANSSGSSGFDLSNNYTDDKDTADLTEFTHNGIVVIDNVGLMLFGGNNKQGTRYAGIINKYKEMLGPDVNVYNLVAPTSVEFWLPEKYKKYSASEKKCIDNIYANLSPDVTSIDAYSVLEQHKDEYIFYRTDHHWSQLGAYYAYTAFCDKLGLECHPLEDYEHKVKQGFVGSLYGYSGDIALKNNPDEFNYYIPPDKFDTTIYDYKTLKSQGKGYLFHEYTSGGSCYGTFLGGDAFHFKITTGNKNGRKIAVFKESYGNAFVPFLVSNFEEIYVIDIRYFGTNAVSYLKKEGVTDVLFIDNIFAANTASLIDDIERLQTNQYGSLK